jgi:transcription initiation factor TFIID subunit 7
MIVCSPSQNQDDQTNTETPAVKEPSKPQSPSAEADDSAKEEEKSYQWSDGLCPPMKNARKRRFRKMKKKKYMDIPEVEKELKRLLRFKFSSFLVELFFDEL